MPRSSMQLATAAPSAPHRMDKYCCSPKWQECRHPQCTGVTKGSYSVALRDALAATTGRGPAACRVAMVRKVTWVNVNGNTLRGGCRPSNLFQPWRAS